MALLVSRRLVNPDGSYGGLVYVHRPLDGSWSCFGLDGFCKLIFTYDAKCLKSFRITESGIKYEYDVYTLSPEAYQVVLDILS